MANALFSGVCTALVTPFLGGYVNYPMLEQLIKRQTEAGISTIALCATTGEAPTLSDEEKITIIQKGKEHSGKNTLLIAGTGSNDTAHAVALSIAAEEAGADALLIVTPYYNKATPDGLIAHFSSIASVVNIPVILYNVPSRTGVDIPIDVYRQLSYIPNIVGVKEASRDITKIERIRYACPQEFSIWSGNDDMTVPTISVGGSGVISVAANVIPTKMRRMVQSALSGDYKAAAAIQISILPFLEILFSEVNPIAAKEAMKIIGYDCGNCRLPLTPMSVSGKEQLRAIIDQLLSKKNKN